MSDVNNNTNIKSDIYTQNNSATKRGTRIVRQGGDMDKNAFLRILAAELSNQDPMNAKDSTQFVAQMAQFASMEQMTNLNSTMTANSANSLIGKGVVLKVGDVNGNPYTGIVRAVTKNGDSIKLSIEVNNGTSTEAREFDLSDVGSVVEVPDYRLDFLNSNASILAGSAMIGKKVEFNMKDENDNVYKGLVKGLVREEGLIKLNVQLESGEIVKLPLDKVVKVDNE